MPTLHDSLRRARREYEIARERGDEETASLLARAIADIERLISEEPPEA